MSSAARMWRAEDLGGLELFGATLSEFAFRPHAHEEFFIAVTDAGLATPVYRGDRHVIGPGDLIVLNPEEAHACGPPAEGSWTYRALYPSQDLMGQIAASSRPASPRCRGSAGMSSGTGRSRLPCVGSTGSASHPPAPAGSNGKRA